MARYYCICGKVIPRKWEICSACREQYGDRRDWHDWMVELVSDNKKNYYQDLKDERTLLPFDDEQDEDSDDDDGKWADPLLTRDSKDMHFDDYDALPYAPYQTEDDNRRYRVANGIPERR